MLAAGGISQVAVAGPSKIITTDIMFSLKKLGVWAAVFSAAGSQNLTIAEINGDKFLSSYSGSTVDGISGLVTA